MLRSYRFHFRNVDFFDADDARVTISAQRDTNSMIRILNHRSAQADYDELATLSATMPPHPDVPAGLKQLKDAGFQLVTLTNSPSDAQVCVCVCEERGCRSLL